MLEIVELATVRTDFISDRGVGLVHVRMYSSLPDVDAPAPLIPTCPGTLTARGSGLSSTSSPPVPPSTDLSLSLSSMISTDSSSTEFRPTASS